MEKEKAAALQHQMTREAVALTSLGCTKDEIAPYLESIKLIGDLWQLDSATTARHLGTVQSEMEIMGRKANGSTEPHVIEDSDLLCAAPGERIVDILRGLFETATICSDSESRQVLFETAMMIEKSLDLAEAVGGETHNLSA